MLTHTLLATTICLLHVLTHIVTIVEIALTLIAITVIIIILLIIIIVVIFLACNITKIMFTMPIIGIMQIKIYLHVYRII